MAAGSPFAPFDFRVKQLRVLFKNSHQADFSCKVVLTVNQLFGVQNQFPSFMANTHRLMTPADCEYYIKRLDALPAKFDQTLEGLKVREQKQITPPRFVVEKV